MHGVFQLLELVAAVNSNSSTVVVAIVVLIVETLSCFVFVGWFLDETVVGWNDACKFKNVFQKKTSFSEQLLNNLS